MLSRRTLLPWKADQAGERAGIQAYAALNDPLCGPPSLIGSSMDRPEIERGELRKIYEQAALWMLLKEDAGLAEAEQRQFERWLKLPYRAEALKEMEALSQHLDVPWRRRRLAIRLAACRQAPPSLPG